MDNWEVVAREHGWKSPDDIVKEFGPLLIEAGSLAMGLDYKPNLAIELYKPRVEKEIARLIAQVMPSHFWEKPVLDHLNPHKARYIDPRGGFAK